MKAYTLYHIYHKIKSPVVQGTFLSEGIYRTPQHEDSHSWVLGFVGVVSASIALLGRIRKPIFFYYRSLLWYLTKKPSFSIEDLGFRETCAPLPRLRQKRFRVWGLGFRVQGLGFGVEFSLRVRCRPLHALVGVSA